MFFKFDKPIMRNVRRKYKKISANGRTKEKRYS